MKDHLIYLASPYSHEDRGVRHNRFVDAARVAGHIMSRTKVNIFCPISHSHPISEYSEFHAMDHNSWMRVDINILRHCKEVYVLMLDGWEESVGVQEEIEFAKKHGMKITYLDKQGDPVAYDGGES